MRRGIMLRVFAVVASLKPKLSQTDLNVIMDGDSLMYAEAWSGEVYYWVNNLRDYLSPICNSVSVSSYALSGQTTDAMLSDVETQIYPEIDPLKTNLLISWEDVNQILNTGSTAQQNFDKHVQYHQGWKDAGGEYSILITGYYPRLRTDGTYNQAAWTQTRLNSQHDFFEMVKNASDTPWDVHVDLRENENIGGFTRGLTVQQPYFRDTDSVHLESAGYDEVEAEVRQGILTIFDP